MDILKKALAPITDKAWKEISDRSGKIFNKYLTARKFIDINGPLGMDFGALSTGRLVVPGDQDKQKLHYGIREILPLLEIRRPFHLDIWELDNISRGARDADLKPLEEAAVDVASFEENCIYYGFDKVNIKGLAGFSDKKVQLPSNIEKLILTINNEIIGLEKKGIEGPYTLVLPDSLSSVLVNLSEGYPVMKQLKSILQGDIIHNHSINDPFLVSTRGGDFELTIGEDLAIGFEGIDEHQAELYFTESFTFRVIMPDAIVVFKHDKAA